MKMDQDPPLSQAAQGQCFGAVAGKMRITEKGQGHPGSGHQAVLNSGADVWPGSFGAMKLFLIPMKASHRLTGSGKNPYLSKVHNE